MTKATHTPGPWKATRSDPAEGYDVWWITGNHGPMEKEICDVPGGNGHQAANARLIAAAPDLLDALQDMRKRFYNAAISAGSDPEFVTIACANADAAIARATGAAE